MRYYWLYALSLLTAAPLTDIATPLVPWDNMRMKHAWNTVPTNWESLGHPPTGTTIDLYIALRPCQESALIDALYEVSDPTHPRHVLLTTPPLEPYSRVPLFRFRYGAHLSKEQVAELVRPYPDTLELVSSWLVHHGVRSSSISTTHGGAWLTVTDVLVSQANQLLGASYQLYRHAERNDTIIRTVGYALPAVLHTHIQTVAPTTDFASAHVLPQTPRRHPVREAAAQADPASRELVTVLSGRDDEDEVTTSLLRLLYKTSAYVPAATDKNSLGVLGLMNEYPSQADLTKFMTDFRNDARAATFTVEQVNGGGNDPSNPGMEANVDIQYTGAMAYPTPLIYYSTGGYGRWSAATGEPLPGDAYLVWLRYMLDQPKVPQTISVSYALPERDRPLEYATALCDLFLQLGVRGVSVLVSSGDNGVGPEDCNDGSGNVRFVPEFPASCTCLVLLQLASTTQAQEQVAYQIALVSQVPTSLASVALVTTSPRSRRSCLEAASRSTFHALTTRTERYPNSSTTSAASMPASTSALAAVT